MAVVEVLNRFFVNRIDCYCVQSRQGSYLKVDEPLTADILERHLLGEITVGSYQLDNDSFVKWLCFDFDPEKLSDPKEASQKILKVCFERQIESDGVERPRIWPHSVLLEASRHPDASYHIWILFMLKVPAQVARWLGLRLLEIAGLNPKKVEVFPKQIELTEERPYGNFVKLPLGKHQVANKWSRLLDSATFEPLPNEVLNKVVGISFCEADLAEIMSFEEKKHVQTSFALPKDYKPLRSSQEERIARFLAKYWRCGFRNRLEMAFLGWAVKRGIAYQSARRIVQKVVELTCDEEAAARLHLVDYHYKNRRKMASRLLGVSGLKEVVREALA